MPVETDYQPKYVEDLSDIPISGPDDYSDEEKRKALYHAETRLELDVNDGQEISASNIVEAHRLAAMNLATHVLTGTAESPSDVTLGDMASGGGNITEYASQYLDRYERIVEDLVSSGLGGSSSNSVAYSVSVNNGTVGDNATTHTAE